MRTTKSQHPAFLYPLAPLALAFACGIAVGHYLEIPTGITLSAAGGCALTALASLRKLRVAASLITIAFLFAGATLALLEKQGVAPDRIRQLLDSSRIAADAPVELTGVLLREPEVAPERLYLQLGIEQINTKGFDWKASGVVALLVNSTKSTSRDVEEPDLRYGARVRVMTSLERADDFRNPGGSSFTEYLDRKGIDASGFIKSPQLIERLDDEPVFIPLALLFKWRRTLQHEIDSNFDSETAGVLDAGLIGNRYGLAHSTSERFREGGTFHVLVISGLHITFLGGLIFFLLRRFTRNRLAQFLVCVAVVWGYSMAVGAEPTVVRAALMFTVVILAPLVSRKATALNVLGGVAIALLVWKPGDLADPSFQLTFVSVLAIVALAWPMLEKMQAIGNWRPSRDTPHPPACAIWLRSLSELLFWSERKERLELERTSHSYRLFKSTVPGTFERFRIQSLLRYAFGALVVSVAVQIALLPFLVVYFHRFSLASFVLNVGTSLLMAGVALCALCGLLAAQISATLAAPLISLTNNLNWLMVHGVDPFDKAGVASLRLPEYSGWLAGIYAAYYIPLVILARALASWDPFTLARVARTARPQTIGAAIVQFAMIAMVIFHPFGTGRPDGKLRVDFLDVGQGDAALLTMPDSTTVLIDGGGRPGPFKANDDDEEPRDSRSIGEAVVSEFLWSRGLDRIDYIVATHADADHIDGLNDVARNFNVRAAIVVRTPKADSEFARFSETLAANQIPLRIVGGGDELQIGNVSLSVFWPPPSGDPHLPSRNDDSLVLQTRFGERTFLFSGDIEKTAESYLASSGLRLDADVLKVAHHGSKTSSTAGLIAGTHPRFAIISVGRKSMFGHPHREVVERWQASGAQVMTTGQKGTITFVTDGRKLEVETFVK